VDNTKLLSPSIIDGIPIITLRTLAQLFLTTGMFNIKSKIPFATDL
jgi:hypothetical protein